MAWTRDRLEEVARTRLGGAKLVVVANREPYIHAYNGDNIRCMRPASGLTTALDPVPCCAPAAASGWRTEAATPTAPRPTSTAGWRCLRRTPATPCGASG